MGNIGAVDLVLGFIALLFLFLIFTTPKKKVKASKQYPVKTYNNQIINNSDRFDSDLEDQYSVSADKKFLENDFYGSIRDLNNAIEFNPEEDSYYVRRSSSKFRINDYCGGLADLDKAIKLNPDSVEAYVIRSLIRGTMGDLIGAKKDIEKSKELLAR